MLRKKFLQSEQKAMDAAAFVDRAREMAAALEGREVDAAGSRPIARAIAARSAGVPASLLHSLRYRPPKRIAAESYQRLCVAVERQAERHREKLQHEIIAARARRLGVADRDMGEIEAALEKARSLLNRND